MSCVEKQCLRKTSKQCHAVAEDDDTGAKDDSSSTNTNASKGGNRMTGVMDENKHDVG